MKSAEDAIQAIMPKSCIRPGINVSIQQCVWELCAPGDVTGHMLRTHAILDSVDTAYPCFFPYPDGISHVSTSLTNASISCSPSFISGRTLFFSLLCVLQMNGAFGCPVEYHVQHRIGTVTLTFHSQVLIVQSAGFKYMFLVHLTRPPQRNI